MLGIPKPKMKILYYMTDTGTKYIYVRDLKYDIQEYIRIRNQNRRVSR